MTTFSWITGEDLHRWAERLEARSQLPRLIRLAIQGLPLRLHRIGFPADEGTQTGGYDGIVQAESTSPYVPDGQSVWELSTSKGTKTKADGDYEKRKKNPLGLDPRVTTYVCVSLRRWADKQAWEQKRRDEGVWADVRVFDAEDLAQWLEQTPGAQLWLAHRLGTRHDGMADLGAAWEEWSRRTNPPLTAELAIGGRNGSATQLTGWLESQSRLLRLKAETPEDGTAFVLATIEQFPAVQRSIFQSRSLVVVSEQDLKQITASRSPLILLVRGDTASIGPLANNSAHRIIRVCGPEEPPAEGDLVLPACSRRDMETALRNSGFPEERANELARECKGRLSVLARLLGGRAVTPPPQWALPEHAPLLAPLVLVGAWNTAHNGDRALLERLTGMQYCDLDKLVSRLLSTADSPLRLTGTVCEWISRRDAWTALSRFLTRDVMVRFGEITIEVFAIPDPRFELPAGERWMANVRGMNHPATGTIRRSLVESLAILASLGNSTLDSVSAQDRADGIVRRILEPCSDPHGWDSLSQFLPLFAESSPDVLLQSVEDNVLKKPDVLAFVFEEDGVMGGPPHTGLLWALENIAWHPPYFSRVAKILSRLAANDPGGRYANRPIESLREVFLTWIPHTCADTDQRLQALDVIARCEPEVAWKLAHRLVSHYASELSRGTHIPSWRTWQKPWTGRSTQADFSRTFAALSDRLLSWVAEDAKRWPGLLQALPNFAPQQREQTVASLEKFASAPDLQAEKLSARNALRRTLYYQRLHPDAPSHFPEEVLARLRNVYERLMPEDDIDRHAWLFSHHQHFPDLKTNDWREEQEAFENARKEAITALLNKGGISLLLKLVSAVELPWMVGTITGLHGLADAATCDILEQTIESTEGPLRAFASSFAGAVFHVKGPTWFPAFFATGPGTKWETDRRVRLACGLPFTSSTWDLVSGWGTDAERLYWTSVPASYVEPDEQHLERAITNLVNAARPWAAVDLAAIRVLAGDRRDLSPTVVFALLKDAYQSTPNEEMPRADGNSVHHIGDLLTYVDKSGQVSLKDLASLEWTYLPLLKHSQRGSPVLDRALATEPEFFLTVIGFVFRAEGQESPAQLDDRARQRARHAWELLHEWSHVPGTQDDGTLDEAALVAWVDKARELLIERGYPTTGDQQIGGILAHGPIGSDGIWPHEFVRRIIERVESSHLERGFQIGLANSRGVTCRDPEEGGNQERDLVEKYRKYAESLTVEFPRTAEMLRGIARSYETEARYEDESRDLNEYI